MTQSKSNKSDFKIQAETHSHLCSINKNYQKKLLTPSTPAWVYKRNSTTNHKISISECISTFSVETAWSTMLMISLKCGTEKNLELNLNHLKSKKDNIPPSNIRSLHSMAMAHLKIHWAVCSAFNQNLPKKIWSNCSLTINMWWGLKQDSFPKTEIKIIVNL